MSDAHTCPVCRTAPATQATARPGLRLCGPCWVGFVEHLRGRRTDDVA